MDWFNTALVDRIRDIARPTGRTLIAIDGRGGSGKSSLARDVADQLGAAIVGVDNFFKPLKEWQPEFGRAVPHLRWEEFHGVLKALRAGEPARYRPYDWRNDRLDAEVELLPSTVIVEGLYAMRQSALEYYDLAIWVEAKLSSRMERVVERDGTAFLDRWNREYLPLEDHYVETDEPWRRADIVVAGAELPLMELGRQLGNAKRVP